MKFFKYIFATILSAMVFVGCSELDKTKANNLDEVVAPVMKSLADIIINDKNKAEEVTFTWSAAEFGCQAVVNYDIYAVCGNSDPYKLFSGINDVQYTTTKDALNLKLAGPVKEGYMGLPENERSSVEFFVTATIGSNYQVVKSTNTVSVNITTTSAKAPKIVIYIPGNHQGWAPADAQTLLQTETKGVFEGFMDLNTDGDIAVEHKFTSHPDWSHNNYGGTYDQLSTNNDDGNIKTESGFYYAIVDLNNLKATVTKTVPALIGDFNGWSSDEPMTYTWSSVREEKCYSATINLKAGEGFKIRFNGGWDYNLGADSSEGEPVTVPGDGQLLNRGGKNMTVAEDGTYTIKFYFDFEECQWRLSCTK